MNLLDKLNSIQIVNRIPEKDSKFIDDYKIKYSKVLNQLNDQISKVQNLIKENQEIENTFEYKHGRLSCKISNPDSFEIWGIDCCFSYQKTLEEIYTNKLTLRNRVIQRILSYFNNEYHLKLNYPFFINTLKEDEELDVEKVIDYILFECNGLSLIEKGIELVKEDLRSCTRYNSTVVKLSKNMVSIAAFQNYDYGYHGNPKFNSYRDYTYKELITALILFDTGKVDLYDISDELPSVEKTGKDIFTFDLVELKMNKISSIKYFKNNKVELKFKTNELASEFIEYFGLKLR